MKLTCHFQTHQLVKDDYTIVKVDDNEIIEYNANYYINPKSISFSSFIETKFIGCIECHRITNGEFVGIYVKPLYVYYNNKWNKIVNYSNPKEKYFLYPHLLMLPGIYYNFHPIYSLDTVKEAKLEDFKHIIEKIDLQNSIIPTNQYYSYENV